MIGWGILLVILGFGSLLLPMFDIQFRLMSLLDEWQPFAGIAVATVGAALIGLGISRRNTTEAPPPGGPSAPDTTVR